MWGQNTVFLLEKYYLRLIYVKGLSKVQYSKDQRGQGLRDKPPLSSFLIQLYGLQNQYPLTLVLDDTSLKGDRNDVGINIPNFSDHDSRS